MRRSRTLQILVVLLGATIIVRLIASAIVPLIPEEAYYWMYAQHPSLSYFDHPPMVAWVIRVGTAIFGSNEIGVRFVGSMLSLASMGLMYLTARFWVDRRSSLAAAAALLVMPIYVWTGFINTMDSQLSFFWLACLFGASLALRRNNWTGWYIAGVGMGGAMLSKYTGIFCGAGIGLALLLHAPWRKWLLSPHVWIGAAVGIFMFTPVLMWNDENRWASFKFQFVDRAEAHPFWSPLTLWSPLNFALLQLVAATPILFTMSLLALRSRRRWIATMLGRPLIVFSMASALPLLAAMAWKSILFDVHFDWTEPLYLGVLPLVGRMVVASLRLLSHRRAAASPALKKRMLFFLSYLDLNLFGCLAGNMGCLLFLLIVQPHTGHPDVFGPWKPLARAVEKYEITLERETGREPLIIGRGKYRLASELAFYRYPMDKPDSSSDFTTSEWFLGDVDGLNFTYWLNRMGWIGRDAIYVSDKNDIGEVVRKRFASVVLIDDPVELGKSGATHYHIAICRNYRGFDSD